MLAFHLQDMVDYLPFSLASGPGGDLNMATLVAWFLYLATVGFCKKRGNADWGRILFGVHFTKSKRKTIR